jgi:DNA end-binding protein Ku
MRTIWKGALSFGLVHIPIRMYSASKGNELKFKMLHKKDNGEIRYARICQEDGKEIPWEEIVKGYEYQTGDYVVLTEDDFKKANLEKTRSIEILDFTEENQIDTIYYDTPYYLEPEKGAASAYALLLEALKRSEKVAVGRFIFHNHEHIGVIRPHGNLLVLHQLRYHNELTNPKKLIIPRVKVAKTEINMALQLIDQLTKPFKPENYSDTYVKELKKVIDKKAKGKKIVVKKTKEEPVKVHNILSLLKSSLKKQKAKQKRKKIA